MLIEFKVANYRSIREEQTLSFIASNYSDELPQNLIALDLPGMKGTRLVKTIALYGANASGKSNIVGALRFFAEFVRDSATKLQPGAPTGVQPFKLDPDCLDKPSKFEITVVIKGVRMLYGLEMTRERVTSEYLVAYPKGKPQVWFERDWDGLKYQWSRTTRHFKHDAALREKARENTAFVSIAAQFNHPEAKCVFAWFSAHLQLAETEVGSHSGLATRVFFAKEETRAQMEKLVKSADLGALGLQVRPPTWRDTVVFAAYAKYRNPREAAAEVSTVEKFIEAQPDNETFAKLRHSLHQNTAFFVPELIHQGTAKNQIALDFDNEESSGTRRFLDVVAQLGMAREANQLSVFDELETSLHPTLFRTLLEGCSATPSNSSQLLFTTHNPLLLDQTLLRRDQIWFTEKDGEGATRLYPLTDYAPRRDESLVKGYLAGRYGGIPFIPEGLNLFVPAHTGSSNQASTEKARSKKARKRVKATAAQRV
jgi:AAA15 family ATPase/GTPase